jgi:ribose transport system permease protein
MTAVLVTPPDWRRTLRSRARAIVDSDRVNFGLAAALVIQLLVFAIASPYFFTVGNFLNIGTAVAINGIVAVGETIVILSGGFDLSVGAAMAASGMVSAFLVSQHVYLALAIVAALAVGGIVGVLNGIIIAYARINALIATLGTLALVRGVGYVISGGRELPVTSRSFLSIGSLHLLGVPLLVWLLVLVFLAFGAIMPRTRYGRYAYAIGSNARAAKLSGVPVNRWRVAFYATSGLLAAVGGILTVARIGTAQPSANIGAELLVITAVILGGASLNGGKGTLSGTFLGVFVLGALNNGLVLLSVPAYWQQIVQGAALLIAVLYDEFRNRGADQ